MIETSRKEDLSKSYLQALCAVKEIAMEINTHDDDSIDFILKKMLTLNSGKPFNAAIGVQLKSSSSNYTETGSFYSWPLKIKNYRDLRMDSTIKSYLFLLILPRNEDEWIMQNIESLTIKKCMFWLDLKEMPDSENIETVTLHFPKTNIVTPEFLDNTLYDVAGDVIL